MNRNKIEQSNKVLPTLDCKITGTGRNRIGQERKMIFFEFLLRKSFTPPIVTLKLWQLV